MLPSVTRLSFIIVFRYLQLMGTLIFVALPTGSMLIVFIIRNANGLSHHRQTLF